MAGYVGTRGRAMLGYGVALSALLLVLVLAPAARAELFVCTGDDAASCQIVPGETGTTTVGSAASGLALTACGIVSPGAPQRIPLGDGEVTLCESEGGPLPNPAYPGGPEFRTHIVKVKSGANTASVDSSLFPGSGIGPQPSCHSGASLDVRSGTLVLRVGGKQRACSPLP